MNKSQCDVATEKCVTESASSPKASTQIRLRNGFLLVDPAHLTSL